MYQFMILTKKITLNGILIHALCWMVFICYELGSVYYTYGGLEPAYIYSVYYAINISFFYLNFLILNYVFAKKSPRYFLGILIFLTLLLLYCILKFTASNFITAISSFFQPFIGPLAGLQTSARRKQRRRNKS
jgi:hypothetical protein